MSLSTHKMFLFSSAKLFIFLVHGFSLPVQNVTTALYNSLSLVGSGIPVCIN